MLQFSHDFSFFPKGEVHTRVPHQKILVERDRSFYRIEMQSLLSLLKEINLQILVVNSTLILFILPSLFIPMLYYLWNLSPTFSTHTTTDMQINIALLKHHRRFVYFTSGREISSRYQKTRHMQYHWINMTNFLDIP